MGTSIREITLTSFLWKFGERISAQLISVIVSIILARILSPSDYGAVAIVMVFITLANVFVTNGFGMALVQKRFADNIDFSSIFWINLLFSFIIYGVIFLTAPYIAKFYGLPVLDDALKVLGIRIIFAAINSIQQAYVSRKMLFKRFFWSTLWGTLLSGIVGVVIAYKGGGVWALIAQYLTNSIVDTFVLWFTVKWRPEFVCSIERAKELIAFGWKMLASALLDTGYNQIRSLLIGKIYSSEDLAFYNQGERFPNLLVTNINSSINSVIFPVMAKSQNDTDKVKSFARRTIQVSSYVLWPLLIGLSAVAEPTVHILLTDKWAQCIPYLRIFCISYGLWPVHTVNLQAISAIGRSDLFLKLEIMKKIIGLGALIVSIDKGPMAIALSMLLSGILGAFINAVPNIKLINYTIKEQIQDMLPPLLGSVAMGLIVHFVTLLFTYSIPSLILEIIVGSMLYFAISYIFKLPGFAILVSTVKSLINRKDLR